MINKVKKIDVMVGIFEFLLIQKIDKFVNQFKESKDVFYDPIKEQLIHPGEFGIYREKICKEFLKSIVPSKFLFGTGFVINTFNEVSSQCDIIIYDVQNTPLIQDDKLQTFYPIETVVAIGEIKSKLSKTNFIETLKKLAKIKKMRENIKNPVILHPSQNTLRGYTPKNHPYDQIVTFLICEKLEFNYENLVNEFDSIYGDFPPSLRHNLILSIDDGLICYYDGNKTIGYPIFANKSCKNRITFADSRYPYFKLFASYMFLATSSASILYPEITDYMGSILGGFKITEKDELE
jgi:hypothetical protein